MKSSERYAEEEGNEIEIPKAYEGDFQDFEELTLSDPEREVLQNLQQLTSESGFEYGQVLTERGFSDVFTSNNPAAVAVPSEFKTASRLSMYHGHTNKTPLSAKDFRLLTMENVERVSVIAANGDVFSVRMGDEFRPTMDEFDIVADLIRNEVDRDLLNHPDFFDWTPQERTYMAIREQAYRIAMRFKWHLEGGRL